VVHTHTAKAGTLGRLAGFLTGVPVRIHTFHGHVLSGYFGPGGSALVRAAELLLARLTTRVVAVSPEVKDDLCERHRVMPSSRVAVIPLGLDLTLPARVAERRGELRAEFGFGADDPVIVMLGRLVPVKEPETALAAAKRVLAEVPGARFLIVGGGELLEPMRSRVAELGLEGRVLFPGFRSDLDRIFADADLAMLTSRNEGTPVALIEAAAAGVPAVATCVGGVPSVVQHGVTGLLVPHGNPRAMAEAILGLLADPARRQTMGRAATQRARERFDFTRLLHDIDDLYRVSLAARRRGT
jgi:glycosyltransferase involved in cell wall biosynthesis